MTENRVTENEVKSLIIDLFKDELKTEEVFETSNFLDLGGDSLGIMTVISAAEEKFKVELNPREVLLHPTPEKISALVLESQTKSQEEEAELSEVDLRKEAVLPDDINPCGNYETDESGCKNIFLTGATGFLGAFLVRDLLNKNGETTVYCLVRCVNKYDGLDRIKSNMISYNCWKDSFRHRIIAVKGDLSKKHFGVNDEEWNDLSEKTDMVFHCGAVLNFLYPYSAMKKTNVSSTVEALRLSVNKKMKYFNYISSYSVYDNPSHFGKNALENDELESPDGYFLGYSETKWVSEKLVRAAQEKGVCAKIYRPGDITGTKEDGIWAVRDLTSRMIIGCIQMKAVPIVEMPLNFTPVDYVSAAIVHIAFMSTNRNKAFNIINPRIGSSTELLKAIYRSKKFVVPVPYPLWKQALKKSKLAKNALKILSCMFDDSGEGDIITRHMEKQPIYDMFNTRTALEGTGIECPPMDAELLEAYISYFKKAKLI
ncbi:MAG: thioester reductase domain-containing protein [Clostridia bacterium]|nr:thioester reductase domain-containing protein [Clostridia bacterium]